MDYKDLDIWKASMELAVQIYELTQSFPDSEKFGLASQMRRASVSVPSNIAEGSARKGNKEFIQFLHQGLGSLSEIETQIIISYRINYLNTETQDNLLSEITKCKQMIFGLIRYLRKTVNDKP